MSDTERFIILCGSNIEPWVAADEIFKMDRFNAIKWIAGGEVEDVTKVIGFDLTRGTCRDATDEIVREAIDRWAHDGEPLNWRRYEFVERFLGVQAAQSFRREEEFA